MADRVCGFAQARGGDLVGKGQPAGVGHAGRALRLLALAKGVAVDYCRAEYITGGSVGLNGGAASSLRLGGSGGAAGGAGGAGGADT